MATKFVLQRFLFTGLRKLSRFYPVKNDVLKIARVKPATFKCAKCGGEFERADVAVDHVHPVIDPLTGFVNWDVYINRLFCDAQGLQVLCLPCHNAKTQTENKSRRKRGKK